MDRGSKFDTSFMRERIEAEFTIDEFARAMNISTGRLHRLIENPEDFRQSEMLCAARLLKLNREEFEQCFFTMKVQKI